MKGEVDTSSITQPVKGDVPDITRHMTAFWQENGYSVKTKVLPRKLQEFDIFTYRLSRGPNGHALLASCYEAGLLPDSLLMSLDTLSSGISWAIRSVKDAKIHEFQLAYLSPPEKERGLIRKNTSFPDKEGKMRTIGILDYWSQLSLKPLHVYIGNFLKKIPQDCTLDQSKFRKLLENSEIFYSVDLSSATDRFPLSVIKQLLEIRLPTDFVNAWADVMVGYPFEHQGSKLIYSTGTPMGAYTSFNAFALTHHYIVFYCCKELGVSWKKLPYALLGDDIVIGNKSVAELYKKTIASLHVDYSPAKTHQSKDFYEFAKRIIYKGKEVSPFPISALRQSSKSSDTLVLLINEQIERGFGFVDVTSSVQLYFNLVKEFRTKLCKKISKEAYYFDRVLNCTRGIVPAWEVFNDILGKNNLPKNWKFTEPYALTCENIMTLSYLKLLQNNIVATLRSINKNELSPVMKTATLLKDFYGWCDERESSIKGYASKKHMIVSSPLYGALYALEKELRNEKYAILKSIDNNTDIVNKKTSKSKVVRTSLNDLLSTEKDKKKVVHTIRELFIILNKNIVSAYWSLSSGYGFTEQSNVDFLKKELQKMSKM